MKCKRNLTAVLLCLLVTSLFSFACAEKKEGKVIVTEKAFEIEKDGKYTLSLNVKGKIKNVGPVDVKNIVVTGRCNTCDEVMISGQWFVTQTVKTPDQKDTVNYLAAGAVAEFQFKDIAFYYTKSGEPPQGYPEGLEAYIESFETVE